MEGKDVDMDSSEMVFDNFIILKELSNISNLVRTDDFLETVPKAKFSRVKWIPMFNYLKQSILDEMVQELSSMWQYENMPQKLEILERQKEKFCELSPDTPVWRPQLGQINAQLKAWDVANLQKQRNSLESLAKDYETKINKLKKVLPAKRGYLKVLQMDIQKCEKKNEDFLSKLHGKFECQNNLVKSLSFTEEIKLDDDDDDWLVPQDDD